MTGNILAHKPWIAINALRSDDAELCIFKGKYVSRHFSFSFLFSWYPVPR